MSAMDELQRHLRRRVVEVLALVSDPEEQRRYQAAVPNVDVAAEIFNQWDDAFHPSSAVFREVFDIAEMDSLLEFDRTLRAVSAATPKRLPPLEQFLATAEWARLRDAASVAKAAIAE